MDNSENFEEAPSLQEIVFNEWLYEYKRSPWRWIERNILILWALGLATSCAIASLVSRNPKLLLLFPAIIFLVYLVENVLEKTLYRNSGHYYLIIAVPKEEFEFDRETREKATMFNRSASICYHKKISRSDLRHYDLGDLNRYHLYTIPDDFLKGETRGW